MKTLHLVSAVLLSAVIGFGASAESKGIFKFEDADVSKVIEAYRAMTGADLIVASNVSANQHKVSVGSKEKMTAAEAAKVIERALLEQAGVIMTRLDERRTSVTFNDALKVRVAR